MTAGWFLALALAATALEAHDLKCPPGWEQEGEARFFSPDTLFEYMNGNAEGYLVYGFQGMHGLTCRRGGVRLHIDVSEMDSPESAWGLYASNRDPEAEETALGSVGQIVAGRAFFARDRFFAELAAEPAVPASELVEPAAFLNGLLSGSTGSERSAFGKQRAAGGIELVPTGRASGELAAPGTAKCFGHQPTQARVPGGV